MVVGLGSTILNFCIYSIVYNLNLGINLASFIGYTCGILNSFYFSDKWVFPSSRGKDLNYSLTIFFVIYFVGGLEMTMVINFMNNLLQNHLIAWICGVFVASANNYLGSKYFLFNDSF